MPPSTKSPAKIIAGAIKALPQASDNWDRARLISAKVFPHSVITLKMVNAEPVELECGGWKFRTDREICIPDIFLKGL